MAVNKSERQCDVNNNRSNSGGDVTRCGGDDDEGGCRSEEFVDCTREGFFEPKGEKIGTRLRLNETCRCREMERLRA
nr:unnamed protein product [Digitaria exilis]